MDVRWWTFIHITGVLGFVLAHGVSVSVALRLRKERDRERIRSLLQLSGSTVVWFYVSFALLLIGGFGNVIASPAWAFEQRWIALSIGILLFVTVMMLAMARPYYKRIREAVLLRPSGVPRVSDEDLESRLLSPTPIVISVVGSGALLAIVWLMIFKPL